MKVLKVKCVFQVITITLFIATIFSTSVEAQSDEEEAADDEGGEEQEPEKSCKKVIFGLARGFIGSALKCLGGQVPSFRLRSPFELLTRFYCIVRCVLGAEGMLNEEGKLDEVAALFYFQENIPNAIIDNVIGAAQPCLEMASEFKPEQYFCQSYAPFTQCVFTALIRAMAPYVVDCFATPGLGGFFSLLQFIVPRAMEGPSAEARKRLEEANKQNIRFKKGTNSSIDTQSWVAYATNITHFKSL